MIFRTLYLVRHKDTIHPCRSLITAEHIRDMLIAAGADAKDITVTKTQEDYSRSTHRKRRKIKWVKT